MSPPANGRELITSEPRAVVSEVANALEIMRRSEMCQKALTTSNADI